MIQFNQVLLIMLSRLNKQRTISSAFHILNGKKSSQTLQDVHLFGLQSCYGLYPKLSKHCYESWVEEFIQHQKIKVEKDSFLIKPNAIRELEKISLEIDEVFCGFKFHRIDQLWLASVQLLCQSLSNLRHHKNQFIPIHDDLHVQYQVKQLINLHHSNREQLVESLYYELINGLNQMEEQHAEVFVQQLTGSNRIGLSKKQLAEIYQANEEDIHLTTFSVTHKLMKLIEENKDMFPVLNALMPNKRGQLITESARKTYELINKGFSLEEIESIRHLKQSTIHDHVVELATQMVEFDISSYISLEKQKVIRRVIDTVSTRRLKIIKEQLDESTSYFQIRLVLAKYYSKVSVKSNE